ncbi:hypothetical protein [Rummeliibacillus pycnus]|uniref:hypothetical protein n=1 Tax=Rummeliibacillus pycnus TaxID=101070 RepID=UPI003D2E7E01
MKGKDIIEHLNNYSYGELQELKKEIISLLILDKERIDTNKSCFITSRQSIFPIEIDIVEEIDDVLERLNQQGDLDSIITGVIQLVKVDSIMVGYLQSATFYKDWVSNNYIAQIKESIKLPY